MGQKQSIYIGFRVKTSGFFSGNPWVFFSTCFSRLLGGLAVPAPAVHRLFQRPTFGALWGAVGFRPWPNAMAVGWNSVLFGRMLKSPPHSS